MFFLQIEIKIFLFIQQKKCGYTFKNKINDEIQNKMFALSFTTLVKFI